MRLLLTGTIFILLSACASDPVIDTKGIDMVQYKQDYAECEALSNQVSSGKQIAKSALFGAVVYGALGAATNSDSDKMVRSGAVIGAAGGAVGSDEEQSQIMRNCLQNRGYAVLN